MKRAHLLRLVSVSTDPRLTIFTKLRNSKPAATLLIMLLAWTMILPPALSAQQVPNDNPITKSPKLRRNKKSKRNTKAQNRRPVLLPQVISPTATQQPPSTPASNSAAIEKSKGPVIGKPVLRPIKGTTPKALKRSEVQEISTGALIDEQIQQSGQSFGLANMVSEEVTSSESLVTGDNLIAPGVDPNASALVNTFDAINFNENANLNGFFQIPPDPSGAAGTTHVVNVTNSAIEWYTKAGVRQNRQRLSSFFGTATTPPVTLTFDPKVIYDQYENRFVVSTMERVEASGMTPNQSRVYFAVSKTNDPNAGWWFFTLTTEEVINGRQTWADFPGLAVDSEAIYFTNNQFAHNNQTQAGVFQGQRLRIIAKAPFYTGGPGVANSYDPALLADANPAGDSTGIATTMQPTQMFGDTPGGLGTFLIAYSGINDFVSGSDANLFVQIIQVDSPLASPTFTGYFSKWGTIQVNDNLFSGLPGAPQSGTTRRIATNDRRFSQHGVYRNGLLYCAASVLLPSASPEAGQVTAHWFILNPATLNTNASDPPPTDQGNIGGEDIAPGTYTWFPTVAVDGAGDLAVGFAASAPTIFPGAYFTGRLAIDPPGTVRGAGSLRAGRDFYIRDFTTSMTVTSRWGDYTGIALDPSDDVTFWVFNEYALPRGTILGGLPEEDGRWGTAWGSFSLATPASFSAGNVLISEFRLRGPAGAADEFIELYNNTASTITVEDANPPATGPSGWAIVSSDNPTVAKVVIPSGVTIPSRGHYLIANNTASTGYSLGNYPAGNNGLVATTATPDRTYTTDIPDNSGLALFRSANPLNFSIADRLDAVGPAAVANITFKEGTGLPTIAASNIEYSFFRNLLSGTPKDTDNNSADFLFVDTAANNIGAGQQLGAPGPENLTSPIQRNALFQGLLLDQTVSSTSPPNRVRNLTPDVSTNSTFGTLLIRRRIVNNTGGPVTRLRFRVFQITTLPSPGPGIADVRVRTASNDSGVAVNDGATCAATGTPTSAPCTVTVIGTTLESPPTQPNGGGLNSSVTAGTITLGAPLATGASINVQFLLGIQQTGAFKFFLHFEALP